MRRDLVQPDQDKVDDTARRPPIFIFGLPRSGTSWVGKILDSHPLVLYRHEPDTVIRDRDSPAYCPPEEIPAHRARITAYVARLCETRTLKTAMSLPVFDKAYHGPLAPRLRQILAVALRGAARIPLLGNRVREIPLPDFIEARRAPAIQPVLKSVSTLGRARLWLESVPGSRAILVIRHPCGQISSFRTGGRLGKFDHDVERLAISWAPSAAAYGLTPERVKTMPGIERQAWNWGVMNEMLLDGLCEREAVHIVPYEQLCLDPEGETRRMLAFCGLDWNDQTEAFVRTSTAHRGKSRYFSVFQDSHAAMNKWRAELSPEEQALILSIVRQTRIGRQFLARLGEPDAVAS